MQTILIFSKLISRLKEQTSLLLMEPHQNSRQFSHSFFYFLTKQNFLSFHKVSLSSWILSSIHVQMGNTFALLLQTLEKYAIIKSKI